MVTRPQALANGVPMFMKAIKIASSVIPPISAFTAWSSEGNPTPSSSEVPPLLHRGIIAEEAPAEFPSMSG